MFFLRGHILKLRTRWAKEAYQELMEIKQMEVGDLIRVKGEKLQLKWTNQDLEIIMMDTTKLDLVQ